MRNDYQKDFNFLLEEFGKEIKIDNVISRGIFYNTNLSSSYFTDSLLDTKEVVKSGQLITNLNNTWIVLTQVKAEDNYCSSRIRKMEYLTNFVIDSELYSFNSFFDVQNINIVQGQVISTVGGKIICTIQDEVNTRKIKISDRFIKFGFPWKIIGFDKTNVGLIYIYAELDAISPNDDLINEIPANNGLKSYTISFVDYPKNIGVGNTFQITTVVKYGNEIVTGKEIEYSVDSNIATIDKNGLFTSILAGTVNIKAKIKDMNVETIVQSVITDVEEVISYDITPAYNDEDFGGNYRILLGKTQIFTANKYINSVLQEPVKWNFVLNPNTIISSKYKFVVINDNSFSIKNVAQPVDTYNMFVNCIPEEKDLEKIVYQVTLGGLF